VGGQDDVQAGRETRAGEKKRDEPENPRGATHRRPSFNRERRVMKNARDTRVGSVPRPK
jgi:hypothetical protein